MKSLLSFSRVFVGGLFILSGLIKANDAVGFSFKLEEYFSEAVFDIPFLMPYALSIAIVMCVAEIVLGLNAILGIKPKLNAWALLLMILFFSGLTFYSAYFDKVTDCGCFGDALKFTPWQSFTKDIVLLVFILVLFFMRSHESLKDKKLAGKLLIITLGLITFFSLWTFRWWFPIVFSAGLFGLAWTLMNYYKSEGGRARSIVWMSTVASVVFTMYTYSYLPIKDYRPYKLEANITEGMTVPEGAPEDKYMVFMQHISTGEIKQVMMQNIDWSDKNWKYLSDKEPVLIEKGYEPPIHDFSISDKEGYDLTEDVLAMEDVIIVISYSLNKSKEEGWEKIQSYIRGALEANQKVISLTASGLDETTQFFEQQKIPMEVFNTDETTLKTIVRSNPGIIRIKKGTIVDKWHFNEVPQKF